MDLISHLLIMSLATATALEIRPKIYFMSQQQCVPILKVVVELEEKNYENQLISQ